MKNHFSNLLVTVAWLMAVLTAGVHVQFPARNAFPESDRRDVGSSVVGHTTLKDRRAAITDGELRFVDDDLPGDMDRMWHGGQGSFNFTTNVTAIHCLLRRSGTHPNGSTFLPI